MKYLPLGWGPENDPMIELDNGERIPVGELMRKLISRCELLRTALAEEMKQK